MSGASLAFRPSASQRDDLFSFVSTSPGCNGMADQRSTGWKNCLSTLTFNQQWLKLSSREAIASRSVSVGTEGSSVKRSVDISSADTPVSMHKPQE